MNKLGLTLSKITIAGCIKLCPIVFFVSLFLFSINELLYFSTGLHSSLNFLNLALISLMIIGPMIMLYAGLMMIKHEGEKPFNYYGNIGSSLLGFCLILTLVIK